MNVSRIAAILAATASLPAMASGENGETSSAAKPAKEKQICVKETAMGSQIPRRVCHTAAEWQVIRKKSARTVDEWAEQPTLDGEHAPH